MKKLFLIFLLLASSITAVLFWQVWQNNRNVDSPSNADIESHFLKSVSWLNSKYTDVENIKNPILWWMVKQAASTSGNDSLNNIYKTYKKNHLDNKPANLSTPMFDKFYRPRMPEISVLSRLHDYQVFFYYGLSCDSDIGSEPLIQKQLKPEFCSIHYLHPRCITHQLMGLRFMQRYQCGYDDEVKMTIIELQHKVASELTWDFRVGDAYIQRVLMLVDTGAYDKVKAIWIKNILDAQNDDGSWDDLDPILYLGNDTVLAHTSLLPKIKKTGADFHATAQAIWLLSMLLEENSTSLAIKKRSNLPHQK